MKSIRELFPLASAATVAANPQMLASNGGSVKPKRGVMNKTESAYADILDAQKRSGEILRYEFEGITLRWADMRYTPDFVVFESQLTITGFATDDCSPDLKKHLRIKLIEIKGGHIWDRDIVRFKGARAYWPEFAFEMWQKTKVKDCTPVTSSWKRKY